MDPRRREAWVTAAALAAAVLAGYGMTLWNPPIYDDALYIADNPLFRLPWMAFLGRVFSTGYFKAAQEGTYQPLVTLLHYPLSGHLPLLRLSGILLHAGNAILVCRLGRELGGSRRQALVAGLLFALFPPSTEAVNLAAFKGHTLAAFFILACLLADLRGRPGLALASLALALFSKETGLVALPLLAARRLNFSKEKPEQIAAALAGPAGLAAGYLALRFLILEPTSPSPFGPTARFAGLSFAWYLRMIALPYPLCLEHTLPAGAAALSAGWVALAAVPAALWALRRQPLAALGLGWVAVALLPFLHFLRFANYSPVADRYLYLAVAGPCLLAAHPKAAGRARFALYALLLGWGCLTLVRNGMYLEPQALFRQAAACAPENPRPPGLLGLEQYAAGRVDESLASFQEAYALDPNYLPTISNLARAHLALGQLPEAERFMREALRRQPGSAVLRDNLGVVLLDQARLREALAEFRTARLLDPELEMARQHEDYVLQRLR